MGFDCIIPDHCLSIFLYLSAAYYFIFTYLYHPDSGCN